MAAGTFDRGAMKAEEVGRASQAIADLVAGDFDLDVDALAVGEHDAEEHDAEEHDSEELAYSRPRLHGALASVLRHQRRRQG